MIPVVEVAPLPLEIPGPQPLPSGRSVIIKVVDGGEELEIRSPQGEVEVCITLTEAGPVVRLRGARLELEATRAVAVSCGRFEVHSKEGTLLTSEGELRVKTEGDIQMDGKIIRLNCETQ